jgi:hypothetical protein
VVLRSSTLKRVAKWAFGVPACVALVGFVLPYIIPNCNPQMYGVGECMIGPVNLAVPILLAVLGGSYFAIGALAFVVGPLLLLAWWLDFKGNGDAA